MSEESTESWLQTGPFLTTMRRHSLGVWQELVDGLATLGLAKWGVQSVYAVGSIGRLEVSDESDVDAVVVLHEPLDDAHRKELMGLLENVYLGVGLKVAKSDGIYRHPITAQALLDPDARGSMNESPSAYGKRIQLLLDARPIFGISKFNALQENVLSWFNTDFGVAQPPYVSLQAELKRYYNAYAIWQNFKFDNSTDDGWLLRQAKLRVTRASTIAGLILLIGASTDCTRTFEVRQHLSLTPLARIGKIFSMYRDNESLREYLTAYEAALEMISDSGIRKKFIELSPSNLNQLTHGFPSEFVSVCRLASRLSAITTRFTLDRVADWSLEFYQQSFA